MHAVKILFLLLLTLAAMRVASWLCLWLLRRVLKRDAAWLPLGANLLALCAFAALLRLDAVPGELLDFRALVSASSCSPSSSRSISDDAWHPVARRAPLRTPSSRSTALGR